MAPFLRQVPARRMARMLRHQIVRKKRMKHDKTEWPTAPATPRSTSERYSWYVLGILTLSQTCHGIDRALIGLVLAPVGKEFGLRQDRKRVALGTRASGSVDTGGRCHMNKKNTITQS